MANYISILLLISTFFIFNPSFAQKTPVKFGKISEEELAMTHYALDSSASAVVLCDYGQSYMDYGTDQFQVIHERTTRIKILTKDGYDYANHSFQLYKQSSAKETYSQLKGYTYNLEDGSIVKTKLEKESIFEEEIDENHDKIKITMPAVKVGSVIEFTYRITSDFLFNFQGWQFQYFIPVAWSEYRAKFIDYYKYQKDFQGYLPAYINESSSGNQTFSVRIDSKLTPGVNGGRTSSSTKSYDVRYNEERIVMKDVPAFIKEPNLTTPNDFISMINYELELVDFPGSIAKRYRGTWESLNNEMLEHDYFGDRTKGAILLSKRVVTENTNETDSDSEKLAKIYRLITNQMTWNGISSKYARESEQNIFESGKGSSADINFLLINFLNRADIKAEPVLVSTRSHGMVKEYNATTSQFNYVICKALVDDKYILLDATEKYLPIGVLPTRCINGRGYTISKDNPGWIDLHSEESDASKITGNIILREDGMIEGRLNKAYGGYNALSKRKSYFYDGDEKFKTDIIEKSNWEIDSLSISNTNDISQDFIEVIQFNKKAEADAMGNMIYFNPIITGRLEKNIYHLQERTYPVSYPSLVQEDYYVSFEIPQGYTMEEIPESFNLMMPNRAASFTYKIIPQGQKFVVFTRFKINKTLFVQDEYPYLKEFYAQMIAKLNEQIVLKKA
ncbi:protein of unknown function [Reichenbachiella agariperforans]|uniref:DUF3857 domain-containing protein n=1 Tax=Reichenbachiella agariperforans TaxID=156994 RepID=A0A1M6P6M2_REIAG|nr:DUF3857 domain-containing protein [Reichenbachiella agariperforans]SHK03611.1 protein of unknown function [Reichenbachiella agariperforans]